MLMVVSTGANANDIEVLPLLPFGWIGRIALVRALNQWSRS